MISDIAAGMISIKYGFRGPNFTTVSACASSSNALIDAFNYIRLGKADVIISGGSEAAVNETGIGGFNALKALSERNDSPETASRPFDKERDGFVLGEGGGGLILENYDHAIKRNAKIHAEIIGFGMSCDAHHITAPHPDGEGARLVMNNAINNANIKKEEIDYINVHGTSTPQTQS
jgi:3-oxoacyl-[acyl-carrier-protein] synthase II